MDLTQLTHTLTIGATTHTIDEPIGFDTLKTKIKRGDYHGISAEVSVGTLEFYNTPAHKAATLIRNAYQTDIDTEVRYTVTDEQGDEIYMGVLDLSTYAETNANATKIALKVGEIGIKTEWNNLVDTKVDLNKTVCLDGTTPAPEKDTQEIQLPQIELTYRNSVTVNRTVTLQGDTLTLPANKDYHWINLSFAGDDTTIVNGWGEVTNMAYIPDITDGTLNGYCEPLFSITQEQLKQLGKTKVRIKADMIINLRLLGNPFAENDTTEYTMNGLGGDIVRPFFKYEYPGIEGFLYVEPAYFATAMITDGKSITCNTGQFILGSSDVRFSSVHTFISLVVSTPEEGIEWDLEQSPNIYIGVRLQNGNGRPKPATCSGNFPCPFPGIHYEKDNGRNIPIVYSGCGNQSCAIQASVMGGELAAPSYIHADVKSSISKSVKTNVMLIKDVFDRTIQMLTNKRLMLQSNWYNALLTSNMGRLAGLRAITTGYDIRNIEGKTFILTFKDLFKSMDAIDAIGWCVEEDGIHIEPASHFYQDNVLLTIDDCPEIKRSANANVYFNEAEIGYKTYEKGDGLSYLDTFHSKRTYTNTLKAVGNKKTLLCELIADPYIIEAVRRERLNKNASDSGSNDSSIFLLQLTAERHTNTLIFKKYTVEKGAIQATGFDKDETYNLSLTPARMMYVWNRYLCTHNFCKGWHCTTGENNYHVSYQELGSLIPLRDRVCIDALAEDDDFQYHAPLFCAETLSLTYPISLSQYKAIKANPYGLIVVHGEPCWIQEMTYEFTTGKADFKLIPKYTED